MINPTSVLPNVIPQPPIVTPTVVAPR